MAIKVFFQTIGVLVQYNWALPYFIVNQQQDFTVILSTNMYSYMMGGFYYHMKQPGRMIPLFIGSGILKKFDKILENALPRLNSDLVHLNMPESPLTDKILKTDIPKVFTFHGSLDPIHVSNISSVCRRLREINDKVDAFVAVSNHSAKTIEESCNFKPIVIHNGIDITLFNPFNITKEEARKRLSLPQGRKIILWSARIDTDKGLHLLIKALPRIKKELNDVMVIVKGRTIDKSYFQWVNALANKLGVRDMIFYDLGWSPNLVMLYYYRASDVYVHTSFSEGFSLTLLEAMASGIPVIGNNTSSIPEAIGYSDFLFNNEEELADKLLNVLCNHSLAMKMGMEFFKRVIKKGFTSKDSAKKYTQLYLSFI